MGGMYQDMTKNELIKAAQLIKEHCNLEKCENCPLYGKWDCRLVSGYPDYYPCDWDIPEREVKHD